MTDDQASWAWVVRQHRVAHAAHGPPRRRGRALHQRLHAVARLLAEPRAFSRAATARNSASPTGSTGGSRRRRRLAAGDRHLARGVAAGRLRTGLIGKWHLGLAAAASTRRITATAHFFGFLGGGTTPMNPRLEEDGDEQRCSQGRSPTSSPTPRSVHRAQDPAGRSRCRCTTARRTRPTARCPSRTRRRSATRPSRSPSSPVSTRHRCASGRASTTPASTRSTATSAGCSTRCSRPASTGHTVVIFTSDHGYNIGHHGLHTKGNGTWIAGGVNGPTMPNMFDTSLRPPFLVRGPGVAGAGASSTRW